MEIKKGFTADTSIYLSCLADILVNTPDGVIRSGLGAHACCVIIHVSKLV